MAPPIFNLFLPILDTHTQVWAQTDSNTVAVESLIWKQRALFTVYQQVLGCFGVINELR